ncbi:hypothetical protein [Leyella stercorea]|jgi:hypothetical protein|uniref:hypothetical protein n=1 Tax=Leyella stercorea TaxID=363265 RepID=UPI00266C122C|nr:hypothetical protein [Leyella stercorea]
MMKDKALEELFLAARPTFDDGDAFIRKLEKRLDAVEYLKQHEETCIRRYRYAMLATFVLGLVLGGGAIAMMLNAPTDQPLFTFGAESGLLLLLGQYSRFAAVILLSGLVCLTIISIVNIVVDLLNMRDVNKAYFVK